MSQNHSCCCANKRKQILPKSLPVTPDAKAMHPCSSVLAYTRSCSSSPSTPLTDVFHCPVYRELWPATKHAEQAPKSTKIHEATTLTAFLQKNSRTFSMGVLSSFSTEIGNAVWAVHALHIELITTWQQKKKKQNKTTFNLACVCQSITTFVRLYSTW